MDKELLLEKYFEQSLTTAERQEFEKLLSEDKDFAEAFAFEQDVKKAFILNDKQELKQKLKSFENQSATRFLTKGWLYAACIAVIAGVSLWFALKQNTTEKLFETYYQSYPNIVAPTVRGTQTEEIKSKAFNAYDNGEYQVAAGLFDQIYKDEHTDFALFYKALSFMELKDYTSAKETFKQFDFKKNNTFTTYFKWYLALAELKTGDKASSILRLKELSATENPMQEMAKKLLNDLD